jgi:hypothetical protein
VKACTVLVILVIAVSLFAAEGPCRGRWIFAECRQGEYPSPGGEATALVRPNEAHGIRMGGFLVLTVTTKHNIKLKANDVTGLLWLNSKTLVYSTEQAYGEPALWAFTVGDPKPRAIVRNPSNSDRTDSDFQLIGACAKPPVLFFNYSYTALPNGKPHVHLYRVNLDGSGRTEVSLDPSIIRHHDGSCP